MSRHKFLRLSPARTRKLIRMKRTKCSKKASSVQHCGLNRTRQASAPCCAEAIHFNSSSRASTASGGNWLKQTRRSAASSPHCVPSNAPCACLGP
eukprot:13364842-Alexandrium_andersonii.AAC.1